MLFFHYLCALWHRVRLSIGAKRNEAVQRTRGEYVVHWDDDDWFRERRITEQVAPLIRGEADITALEHHLYYYLLENQFYVVTRVGDWGPHFGTLVCVP